MDTIMNYNTTAGSQLMPDAWLEKTRAKVTKLEVCFITFLSKISFTKYIISLFNIKTC